MLYSFNIYEHEHVGSEALRLIFKQQCKHDGGSDGSSAKSEEDEMYLYHVLWKLKIVEIFTIFHALPHAIIVSSLAWIVQDFASNKILFTFNGDFFIPKSRLRRWWRQSFFSLSLLACDKGKIIIMEFMSRSNKIEFLLSHPRTPRWTCDAHRSRCWCNFLRQVSWI